MGTRRRKCQRGFTLIEALVAFLVLALAISAATRMTTQSVDLASQLRFRLMADWVVQNRIEEYRAMAIWPGIGVREGEVEQAGERFLWHEVVAATAVGRFRRIEVTVATRADPETILARQVAALADPAP